MKIETVEGLYNKGFRTLNVVAAGEAEALEGKVGQLQKENAEFRAVLQFIADIEQERLDEVSGMADTALATTKRG
jgi:hypothetical protein